jgi:hypothetical protein
VEDKNMVKQPGQQLWHDTAWHVSDNKSTSSRFVTWLRAIGEILHKRPSTISRPCFHLCARNQLAPRHNIFPRG